ncbi:MAG: EAL domain-containing protein, partial [Halieaceae bacterium]
QWTVHSFEDRLTVQAENSVGALSRALSLSDLSNINDLDHPICTLLASVPDTLEFRSVELIDELGNRRCYQTNTPQPPVAPSWFIDNLEIQIIPATQPIQQGWVTWELIGIPYEANAYDELWSLAINTFWGVLALLVSASVGGFWALQKLLDPLRQVVVQAKSIGERRFTKIAIPTTTEFADVAQSMNDLSDRIQSMLSDEAALLKDKKASYDFDEVTGLLNRETFIDQFSARLNRENEESIGSVALIRLLNLAEMNREYGRGLIDNLLKDVGEALNRLTGDDFYGGYCSVGRLNGADICAIATNESNAKNLADTMQRTVAKILATHNIDKRYTVAAACIDYEIGDNTGELLTSMDNALAQSELQAGVPIVGAQRNNRTDPKRASQKFWHENLASALADGGLRIVWYPVLRKDQSIIHLEGMARLAIDNQEFNAGEFMPWVFRQGLGQAFDRAVVTEALKNLSSQDERLHVNLSADSLKGVEFSAWLDETLKSTSAETARFGMEISETAIIGAQSSFEALRTILKPYGCQLGIEHMGYRPEIIAELGNLGPDYLKVDSLYTQALSTNQGNRSVLTSFSGVAKSLGIDCIAEGINTAEDVEQSFALGAKGV